MPSSESGCIEEDYAELRRQIAAVFPGPPESDHDFADTGRKQLVQMKSSALLKL